MKKSIIVNNHGGLVVRWPTIGGDSISTIIPVAERRPWLSDIFDWTHPGPRWRHPFGLDLPLKRVGGGHV